MRLPRILLTSTVVALGCQADEPLRPTAEQPSLAVSDGAHGGNGGFYFLPPLVAQPSYNGTFDASLSPVVEICEWTGTGCVTPLLAVFTTTSGPGSERVRVMPEDELYIVNWRTSRFTGKPAKIYRIFVRVGPLDLGYADVNVVGSLDEGRNVGSDGSLVVEAGSTVPIKFRIEERAVPTGVGLSGFDPDAIVLDESQRPLIVNQLLIAFQEGTPESSAIEVLRSIGGTVLGFIRPPDTYQIQIGFVSDPRALARIVLALRSDPRVLAVVTGYFLPTFGSLAVNVRLPIDAYRDDLDRSKAWAFRRILLGEAWQAIDRARTTAQLNEVNVAIIDGSGVFTSHEEFGPPSGEHTRIDGVDLSSCPERGWDRMGSATRHGTPIAGILGAVNDGEGMNGVLGPATSRYRIVVYKIWDVECELYSVKPIQPIGDPIVVSASGWSFRLVDAIRMATTERHVDVVSMSIGIPQESPFFFGAATRARVTDLVNWYAKNSPSTVFVASAGNDGGDTYEWWPSGIDAPNFVRVGGVGLAGDRWSGTCGDGSSNGSGPMLAAPAELVYAPSSTGPLAFWWANMSEKEGFCGTSAAAPFVAGVAALMKMVSQQSMTGEQIVQLLHNRGDPVTVNLSNRSSAEWRVVDACGAVAAVGIECPVVEEPVAPVFTSVSAGWHNCALATDGAAYCWGPGQLGNGSSDGSTRPVLVSGGLRFASVSAGRGHSCGVTTTGAAYCWGENLYGQLGNGFPGPSSVPVPVSGTLSFASIDAGGNHTCGVTTSGEAYCWGSDQIGQLGDVANHEGCPTLATPCSRVPVLVSGGLTFRSISASGGSCGVTTDNRVFCWGGVGTSGYEQVPEQVGGSLRFLSVSRGNLHVCGISTSDETYCWGDNDRGQLGNGSLTASRDPVLVDGGHTFVAVSASKLVFGAGHTCAVTATGAAHCWGDNAAGQLGTGSTSLSLVPAMVAGTIPFRTLAAGLLHTCGVSTEGVLYCWGANNSGELGNGSTTGSLVPVPAADPE